MENKVRYLIYAGRRGDSEVDRVGVPHSSLDAAQRAAAQLRSYGSVVVIARELIRKDS